MATAARMSRCRRMVGAWSALSEGPGPRELRRARPVALNGDEGRTRSWRCTSETPTATFYKEQVDEDGQVEFKGQARPSWGLRVSSP